MTATLKPGGQTAKFMMLFEQQYRVAAMGQAVGSSQAEARAKREKTQQQPDSGASGLRRARTAARRGTEKERRAEKSDAIREP